jgi:glutathione S-transferase
VPSGLCCHDRGAGAIGGQTPTLWQIDVSHYSEKARWALAHKGIEHRRYSPMPGVHMPIALLLTRGKQVTFPVLRLDGRTIGDSTAIIAALEERYPEPPLYPSDPELRRRALELEDFFDEELGPHIRQLAWFELTQDRERMRAMIERTAPGPLARVPGPSAAYARTYTALRFGAGDRAAAEAGRGKVLAALDRLDSELESTDGDYLVGDRFSVADLTAASLFYPLVLPEEGPLPADEGPPAGMQRFREPLEDRPGFRWVAEMFRRHRRPGRAGAGAEPEPDRTATA